ncbi:MAG TPA: hypothetical protein PK760_00410 [Flavobacteriales bacterium]|nr:hypothetical protein [Flavobacteriales bacterium]
MERKYIPSLEAVALAALLAIAGLSLFAAPAKADEVMLTGWLHVEDHYVDDLVISVEVGDDCVYAEVESSGRFTVLVPAGSHVVLSFVKPGCLDKEVLIDTNNALINSRAQRANHKIKFDVVLEPKTKRPGRKYEGPVGSLTFFKGTGTMKVKHDVRVVGE